MKSLKDYFKLQEEIFQYFGYKEDWVCIPLSDETSQYWTLQLDSRGGGECIRSPEPITRESIEDGSNIYSGSIYTQRFLPKWVYRGPEYTMVCVDTHCDGNKFLMVFDNTKECPDPHGT